MKKFLSFLAAALMLLFSGCSQFDDSRIWDKIYYTTTDGKKLFPYRTESALFGATLISNTYENGQGVLTFDDAITSIGDYAFYGCSSLASITIPDGVTEIGDRAFKYCSSLASVTIGDGVTEIGDRAFYDCDSLTSVYITDIAAWCAIDFSNNLANPLYYAHNLYLNGELVTDLVIPDGVTEIGELAFQYFSSLASVTIGDSVTSIGKCAFKDCSSLTSVTIGDGVISIGKFAFWGCSSLTSVTIGDSVTEIGNMAFAYCSSLASVYCKPTTPPTGDSGMFFGYASGRKIYVPTASVSAYKAASGWSTYAEFIRGYEF